MAPIGRPKVDATIKKAGMFSFRLSEAERAAIESAAAKDGKRATTWARDILLAKAKENG